jgi:hypothetical protein
MGRARGDIISEPLSNSNTEFEIAVFHSTLQSPCLNLPITRTRFLIYGTAIRNRRNSLKT